MEKEIRQERSFLTNFICTLLLTGVFAVCCLVLCNAGLKVYQNIVLRNNDNFSLRTSLAYVAAKVRQTDAQGLSYLSVEEGTPVLALGEEIEGSIYETLIYCKDGYLMERFKAKDDPAELDYGTEIVEAGSFAFELTGEGLLHITAENKAGDREEIYLSFRSGRSAEQTIGRNGQADKTVK